MLAVLCSHLIGVFWILRDFAALATATPVQAGANPAFVGLVSHPWFNLGPFGVGIFFLISGLVIPFSLDRHTQGTFLLARLLRVYPTYVAALAIEVGVIAANAWFWNRPFPHGAWTVVSNALLIHDLVGNPSIDLVNWTLCIEVRFYLLMAVMAGFVRRGSLIALAGMAVSAAVLILAARLGVFGAIGPEPILLSYTVSVNALFILFMLMGVLFNYHYRQIIDNKTLIFGVMALGCLFGHCWTISAIEGQFPGVPLNYLCALVLFGSLYAMRSLVPPLRGFDALAAISFPLYLLHSCVGYSVMKIAITVWMLGPGIALLAAILLVLILSASLHAIIEKPMIDLGRTLSMRDAELEHRRSLTGRMIT